MDPDSNSIILQLVILLILIGVNAFFAMSEIAIVTFNDNKLKKLAEDGNKRAATLYKMVQQPSKFLSTIQIGVTMAGFLAAGSAAEQFAEPVAQLMSPVIPYSVAEPIALFVITLILGYFNLVLGELVPKRIAMHNPEKVSLAVAPIVRFVFTIAKPLVALLSVSTNAILKLIHISPEDQPEQVTEEEIRMMVDIGEENGAIESDEKRMIENVFEFNNTTAAEVMTHRTELVALEIDTPPDEVERVLLSCGFSRVPVYRNDIDDIVGMLHFREYLSAKLKGEAAPDIRKLLKPVYFAPGTMRANILFRNMQSRKFGMAVILDEFGGTSGIVSVEDLLEEIVGSLYDEYDEPEVEIEEVAENEWRIGGSMRLDEIARKLDILLPEEEYDTIGGLVFGELNAIPTVGAVVELPEAGVTIRVVSVDERRVEQVLLTRQPRTAEEEAEEE